VKRTVRAARNSKKITSGKSRPYISGRTPQKERRKDPERKIKRREPFPEKACGENQLTELTSTKAISRERNTKQKGKKKKVGGTGRNPRALTLGLNKQ